MGVDTKIGGLSPMATFNRGIVDQGLHQAMGRPPWRRESHPWRAPMLLPEGHVPTLSVEGVTSRLVLGLTEPRASKPFTLEFDCLAPSGQLENFGITTMRQQLAYVSGRSERLYSAVTPDIYSTRQMFSAMWALAGGGNGSQKNEYLMDFEVSEPWRERRLDAWGLYLGLPQRYDTFEISRFEPQQSSARAGDVEYFSLRGKALNTAVLRAALRALGDNDEAHLRDTIDEDMPGILGTFYVSRGTDGLGTYISYYDVWDLEPVPGVEASKVAKVGQPFEVYGRIYYEPETGEVSDIPEKTLEAHAQRLAVAALGRRSRIL